MSVAYVDVVSKVRFEKKIVEVTTSTKNLIEVATSASILTSIRHTYIQGRKKYFARGVPLLFSLKHTMNFIPEESPRKMVFIYATE